MEPVIKVRGLNKGFVLHTQGGVRIPVCDDVELSLKAGECLALVGPSGSGKSTLLRCLYANYKPLGGQILVRHRGGWVDMAGADPHQVLQVRRHTMGYVSQFLRVIPRVPALQVVAEPLLDLGWPPERAEARATELLTRLNIPQRLWSLAPATFSGGEQQRVNIARGFAAAHPILLLDEPTASLDLGNRVVVVDLINQAKSRGAALIGIFHDDEVRSQVADRSLNLKPGIIPGPKELVPCPASL